MPKATCTVVGCSETHHAKGLCRKHYKQHLLAFPQEHRPPTTEERFWAKVDVSDLDGCWPWTGALTAAGYGSFRGETRTVLAHRFVYELLVGPIPEGLELDHLCHTNDPTCHPRGYEPCPHRACVNPLHLEPVTHAENSRRGRPRGRDLVPRTHCGKGHEYTAANTRWDRRGTRHCRICAKALDKIRIRDRRKSARVVVSTDPDIGGAFA